jgi:hypothetical protein
MANGVAEILPMQPFAVLVVNTSHRERKLPKGMVLGQALPHLKGIIATADAETGELSSPPVVPSVEAPPIPDRPDIEGVLRKREVDLARLLPHEREKVLRTLETSLYVGRPTRVRTQYVTPDRPYPGCEAYTSPAVQSSAECAGSRVCRGAANAESGRD